MGYTNYDGYNFSYDSFFTDNVIDKVVNFDDDNDYVVNDIFDYEGITFAEIEDSAGNTYFLSDEFLVCENLSDYFDEDKELEELYPSFVRNPRAEYEEYLYEMQRDKEIMGW